MKNYLTFLSFYNYNMIFRHELKHKSFILVLFIREFIVHLIKNGPKLSVKLSRSLFVHKTVAGLTIWNSSWRNMPFVIIEV